MGSNKKICVFYIQMKIEEHLIEELCTTLEEVGYDIQYKESPRDLNLWMKESNIILPGLIITDLFNTEVNLKQMLTFFKNVTILCIHEDAVSDENAGNGNIIKAYNSYDEVISTLNAFKSRVPSNKKPILSVDSHKTDPALDSESDIEEEEEVHPALLKVTEFEKSKEKENVKSNGTKTKTDTEKIELDDSEVNMSEEILQQDNSHIIRSREIQNQLFKRREWQSHQRIGLWSPLHRMGTTSLTINFALYLAQNKYDVAVLEGLTEQHAIKDWLKRYTDVPKNWNSFAKVIQTETTAENTKWNYLDVMFLPLDKKDPFYNWNEQSLEVYMKTTEMVDVTLIDLPTGVMKTYTKDSLRHLDQLWIIVDDAIQETIAWKDYIVNLKKEVQCPIFLVFNKHYSFSQNKKIGKEFKLPIITCIPSLHEETMRNYYEDEPLYLNENVRTKIDGAFAEMAAQITNKKFVVEKEVEISEKSWGSRVFNPLKSIFKPLKSN